MQHILTAKEYSRMSDEYDKVKYRCSCGHRVVIPRHVEKNICSWCGKYVFKDKSEEFKYRMKEKIRRIK